VSPFVQAFFGAVVGVFLSELSISLTRRLIAGRRRRREESAYVRGLLMVAAQRTITTRRSVN
jgi:hypothetical protein